MALEMIDSNERPIHRDRQAFGSVVPDKKGRQESGPTPRRDAIKVAEQTAGMFERALHQSLYFDQMIARRHFWDHTSESLMEIHLTGDFGGQEFTGTCQDCHGRLITGCLDGQNQRAAHCAASWGCLSF